MSAESCARLERRRLRWSARLERLSGRVAAIARVRLLSFCLGVAALAAVVPWSQHATALRYTALAAGLVFVVAFLLHRRPREREGQLKGALAALAREQLRAAGRWKELPRTGTGLLPGCAFASDLGLVGPWSLFRAISRCATPFGERTFARLLGEGAPLEELAKRQQGVSELARRDGFRLRLEAEEAHGNEDGDAPEELVRSLAPRSSVHDGRPWLAPLTGLLGLAIGVQLLHLFGAGDPLFLWPCVALQTVVFLATRRRVEAEYRDLLLHEGALVAWTGALGLIERHRFRSELASELSAAVAGSSDALRRLNRILGGLSARLTAMHPVLNILGPWDLLHVRALARWRAEHGEDAARWFEALGEWEALSSLAGHAAGQEELVFAELDPEGPAWEGEGAWHPLLPPREAIANDAQLAGSGSVLLVTGSNMSGKSTMLRTIGLNTVLAQAGAAVCAKRLRLRPCRIESSIHVTDALDAGVSLFNAEVRQLKAILDAVDEADADESIPPVLFLVDEILRGTNTRERLIASRAVIRRLAASRSAGLVTSHELGLAALAGELPSLRNVHVRESVGPEGMSFDYLMREGPVTTTNALEVLRREGVNLDFDAERE